MEILIGIQLLLIIFVLGITNGYINLHAVDCKNDPVKCKKYSKMWHNGMTVIKVQIAVLILLVLIYYIGFTWKLFLIWFLAWVNFSSTIYDLSINAVRKFCENIASLWRIDDGRINGFLKKIFGVTGIWIIRGILIVINILIIW